MGAARLPQPRLGPLALEAGRVLGSGGEPEPRRHHVRRQSRDTRRAAGGAPRPITTVLLRQRDARDHDLPGERGVRRPARWRRSRRAGRAAPTRPTGWTLSPPIFAVAAPPDHAQPVAILDDDVPASIHPSASNGLGVEVAEHAVSRRTCSAPSTTASYSGPPTRIQSASSARDCVRGCRPRQAVGLLETTPGSAKPSAARVLDGIGSVP